jgi:hypothetical protein
MKREREVLGHGLGASLELQMGPLADQERLARTHEPMANPDIRGILVGTLARISDSARGGKRRGSCSAVARGSSMPAGRRRRRREETAL